MIEENEEYPQNVTQDSLSGRVISTVQKCPNHTIRPARLAAQLGISIDDASAELCGLLAAVGGGSNGATFSFERSESKSGQNQQQEPPVMVFHFPPNFESKAKRFEKKESIKQMLRKMCEAGTKFIKVLTAFGLILSLFIIGMAVFIVLVSAMIALLTQRGNSNNHHTRNVSYAIQRHIRMFRNLLWCYAMFGGGFENNNDAESMHPFLREVAMIVANVLSCLSGGGIFYPFFWMRNRRRIENINYHYNRGFGARFRREPTELSGVADFRRGVWGSNVDDDSNIFSQSSSQEDNSFRGILSTAVEFLFGPTPFWPGPKDRLKWRLRAEIITSKTNGQISLQEMIPFFDIPPNSFQDSKQIIASGLEVVAHFNGIPVMNETKNEESNSWDATKSTFRFPELLGEVESGGLPTPKTYCSAMEDTSALSAVWYSLLYQPSLDFQSSLSVEMNTLTANNRDIPNYLHEQKHVLTKLTAKQFYTCITLGVLNYLGMIWFCSAVQPKGALASLMIIPLFTSFLRLLAKILMFYSKLFFLLPLLRLGIIMILNYNLNQRNEKRKRFSQLLAN